MDILYLLIPMSAVLVLGILAVFAWALHGGQFDDLEQHGEQILDAATDSLDTHQRSQGRRIEESPSSTQLCEETGALDGWKRADCNAGELHR
jgi:cbb3-type cytochrome oxidase maturation protein